jgi:hypothetical protein
MRVFGLLTLFAIPATCLPVEFTPQARHPAIDTLNQFADQLQTLADDLNHWDGNRNAVDRLLNSGKRVVSMLGTAVNQVNDSGDVDYFSSALGLSGAALSVTTKTHSFANAVTSKIAKVKAVGADQAVFQLLDQAYSEARGFFEALKAKSPGLIYNILSPFRNELLGTVAEAREQYRPKEVVVVIVPESGGGSPAYTFAGGVPTGLPAGYGTDSQYQYQPANTYSPNGQYQTGSFYQPQLQYTPNPVEPQYTRYTPAPTPTIKPGYTW